MCRRAILLQHGRVVKDGLVDEVIPHYESIVYKKTEEELKSKIGQSSYRVKVKDDAPVTITNLKFFNEKREQKNHFWHGETVHITVEYNTKEKIDAPMFLLEIVRSDNVVCCASRADDEGTKVDSINGKGSIDINLGQIKLGLGIYIVKVSILDKEMIHPYAVRNEDILKFEVGDMSRHTNGVFFPPINWEIK
jgi:hypothetical protein